MARAPSSTTPSETGAATVDVVPADMFWVNEPGTLNELEEMYEVVATCPGRVPTTALKIVKACPKSGEPTNIIPDQQYKLFLAPD